MKIQDLIYESLVAKQVEFNTQELIVLSTFVETIQANLIPDPNVKPFTKHDQAIELLTKVVVLLTPIISGVEGLEATAKELFTESKERFVLEEVDEHMFRRGQD